MAHDLKDKTAIVLVVDDDKAIRGLEVRALRHLGYKVLEAEGPVKAMRLAITTPAIHLLLTDFWMPEGTGLELARRFRTLHPRTPVLLVSGSLEAIDSLAVHRDRIGVLVKPFTPRHLAHWVRALLSGATDRPRRSRFTMSV
jgi:DNA-binding response OmpR family regulator